MPAVHATFPADHPVMKPPRLGVLIANLGTPDNYDYWSIRRYLSEFLSDQRVIDYPRWKWQPLLQLIILSKRPFTSGKLYKSIWNHDEGESPLMTITKAQTNALREVVQATHGEDVMVEFCMRYGNPSTRSKVREMVEAGCNKIMFLPLYPQYAGATTATANDAFFAALASEKRQPSVRTAGAYYNRPSYIDALAESVKRAYAKLPKKPDILVASYHGMPERYLANGDPYYCHCLETSRLLAERLGWAPDEIRTSFQSIFGREEWLRPYTVDELAHLTQNEGKKNVAVIAPAFSADCIETLEEIDAEFREKFLASGGESFTYIPCLNDTPEHISALAEIIDANLTDWQ